MLSVKLWSCRKAPPPPNSGRLFHPHPEEGAHRSAGGPREQVRGEESIASHPHCSVFCCLLSCKKEFYFFKTESQLPNIASKWVHYNWGFISKGTIYEGNTSFFKSKTDRSLPLSGLSPPRTKTSVGRRQTRPTESCRGPLARAVPSFRMCNFSLTTNSGVQLTEQGMIEIL